MIGFHAPCQGASGVHKLSRQTSKTRGPFCTAPALASLTDWLADWMADWMAGWRTFWGRLCRPSLPPPRYPDIQSVALRTTLQRIFKEEKDIQKNKSQEFVKLLKSASSTTVQNLVPVPVVKSEADSIIFGGGYITGGFECEWSWRCEKEKVGGNK